MTPSGAASSAALEYGAALGLYDADALADRLYAFGRRPLSPRRRRTDPVSVVVGTQSRPARQLASAGWHRRVLAGMSERWALWLAPGGDTRQAASSHKLYVSPAPGAMAAAFEVVAQVLPTTAAVGVKVGIEPSFLARPDKLVIYLCDRAETLSVGHLLASELRGRPADPVPFACSVGDTGVVSWGVDPPDTGRTQESWRGWVAHRLAEAMLEAPMQDRVAAARQRIADLGVDPHSWEPGNVVWAGRAAH